MVIETDLSRDFESDYFHLFDVKYDDSFSIALLCVLNSQRDNYLGNLRSARQKKKNASLF